MSEWRECKLGDFAEIQTGPFGSQLHAADYVDVGIPSIMPTNIGSRLEVRTDSIACIKEADAKRLEKYLIKENDIVYSRRGDVEKCAFITSKQSGWLCGTGCLRVRIISPELFPKFCAYYLSTDDIKGWVSGNAVGTTMPNLNSSILKRLPLTLPPLPEQKVIAAVLSSLDDKIDLLHRQNVTLEAMAETLFRQWFVVEAKEDWVGGTIADLIDIQSGFAFKSSTFIESGKYKLITIKAVQDGYLELSGADQIDVIPTGMPDYCHLSKGDILLSLTGNVGRCCLVDNIDLLLNQRVAKLQPKAPRDWAFAYIHFRQSSTRRMLEEMAKGTAQANLSPIETAKMGISIPSIAALESFSERVTPCLTKVLNNKAQIKTLEKLRDTLLPKLMSGEIRVKVGVNAHE
jgi:type I restriction enzyme, S subunit